MVLERGVGIVPVIYLRRFAPLHSGTGEPRVSRPAAEVLSDAEAKERGDWRKRVRVERTIDTARRQSPVLKTGRVTGPPSLPQRADAVKAPAEPYTLNYAPEVFASFLLRNIPALNSSPP